MQFGIAILLVANICRCVSTAEDRPAIIPSRSLNQFENRNIGLDPAGNGWESEVFHDLTKKQLEKLGRAIESSQSDEKSLLSPVLAQEFQCTDLRPKNLDVVFNDSIFVVRRMAERDNSRQAAHESVAGLREAIAALTKQPIAGSLHSHFKAIRVDMDQKEQPSTSVVFQLGGSTELGHIQQTSMWVCHWTSVTNDELPKLKSIRVTDFEESLYKRKDALFDDRTNDVIGNSNCFRAQLAVGIDHWTARLDRRLGIDLVATHGLAVGDIDGDGLDDLYVCEPGGLPNRLFLHKFDGTARDVSAVTGTDYLEPTKSALILDLDSDGDQDIVMASDRFVVFLANDGWGRFRRAAGFSTSAVASSMAAADYDLDGDLDIYVCGYSSVDGASMIGLGNPIPFHDANNGARNTLYRNDGQWMFTDVTQATGLEQDNMRFSLAVGWEDYDQDGDPDLYVANDYGRNCLYRNDQGKFTNVADVAGVEDISAGMSVSWADFNRDGLPDLYVSNMFSSAGNRVAYQRKFKQQTDESTRTTYQRFARGNSLFLNLGDGTFRDATMEAQVTMGRWAWSSNFIDLNNDGWEDMVVANGMVTSPTDSDDL